jgi:hypothetical protein
MSQLLDDEAFLRGFDLRYACCFGADRSADFRAKQLLLLSSPICNSSALA